MAALDDLRIDIRQLLTEHFRPDATVRSWWAALADAGLTAPNWPKPFGRGLSSEASRIVTEELVKAGAIAPPQGGVGMRMAGPTLLAHGTEEQKETYLWPLLRGEESWCQLFSEPGAGSDLPILSTKALLDGDEFVISGQKVWNSAADLASRGMLLARTNADVPKREGITLGGLCFMAPRCSRSPPDVGSAAHHLSLFFVLIVLLWNLNWRVAGTALDGLRRSLLVAQDRRCQDPPMAPRTAPRSFLHGHWRVPAQQPRPPGPA